MSTQRQRGKRTATRAMAAGARARQRSAGEIVIQVDGEVDDLFTAEMTTADVDNVLVTAETDPEAGGRAIVELKSAAFNFPNNPKGNSIMFEADRESLYALGVALLRVANRVQHRHTQAPTA